MLENFILFSNYNTEMNQRVYLAAQQLSREELLKNRSAYFGSVMGTLNHLLVADTLWLQRIAQHPAQFSSIAAARALPKPDALNQMLFAELPDWYARRTLLDQMIEALMRQVNSADLESILFYTRTEGMPANKRLKDIFLHFFNHQTHHRGQISTLLFQAGVDMGVTDLLSLIPNVVDN